MAYSFFKKVSAIGSVLSVSAAAVFGFRHSWLWSCGVLVGYCWVFLNGYFLFQLLELSFTAGPRSKNRIFFLSILKFPVLYVAGYFILTNRVFPIYGILLGLTFFFLAFFVVWLKSSLGGGQLEKGPA